MAEKPIDLWLTLLMILPYLIIMVGISGIFIAAFKHRQRRRQQLEQGPVECPRCHKTVEPWLWENQDVRRYICPECGHPLDRD